MKIYSQSFALIIVFLFTTFQLSANNGSVAYIYPISDIIIDGDLSDWPTDAVVYSMENTHYGEGLDGKEDGSATWRAGYNAESGHLYIGVTMLDNDYVKTPGNSHFTSHDFQVLYLDPTHSPEGAGVIAYELDEDHRKIVEQDKLLMYSQVRDASFDQVEVKINRKGNVVTYEWKVKISGPIESGRVVGFDYGIFDKDTDEDHVMLTWGSTGGNKFMNSNLVGDLVLLDKESSIGSVHGNLEWSDKKGEKWPSSIRFINQNNASAFFDVKVDAMGKYNLELPEGTYDVSVPPSWIQLDWNVIDRVESLSKVEPVTVVSNEKHKIKPIRVTLVEKPDLIPEKGILLQPFSVAAAKRTDKFIEQYSDYYNVPGISLALIQDGRVVYEKSYGVENASTKKELRNEAVFEAASVTKLVFSYVINKLVQRGDFDLDKPLYETLPFPELEEFPDYKLMTGRHVLTHVTGLPNWGTKLNHKPGTTYGYSGEGFEYLKRVLVGEERDDWDEIIQGYLEKELLQPLKMTNTYFMCNDQLPDLKVAGHFEGVPNMFDCPDGPGMAWSMHTEARDFTRFALALINREGLTEEQAKEMFKFHTTVDEEDWIDGHKVGFGLGVALRESPQGLVYGHGGNNGDFRCSFEIYDELNSGYIVFTNADTAEPLLWKLKDFFVEGKVD